MFWLLQKYFFKEYSGLKSYGDGDIELNYLITAYAEDKGIFADF